MSKIILVIDDEESVRNFTSDVLSDAGYKVFVAENGKEAINFILENHVDLIITDIVMPDMEGIEFIKIVKSQNEIPFKIIAMSGYGLGNMYLHIAQVMGVNATIDKPFSDTDLLELVQRVMN